MRGREGLGLGDGKLLSVMGALLGWKALPPIVFVSSLLGVLVAIPALLITQKEGGPEPEPEDEDEPEPEHEHEDEEPEDGLRYTQIPFGPFLAFSAIAYVFLADALWPWFLDFLGGGM